MSVQHSPPRGHRQAHNATILTSINNQPLAVRPNITFSHANMTPKEVNKKCSPTVAFATITTNTSTTTTASTTTATTMVSTAFGTTPVMCTALNTCVAEKCNNSKQNQPQATSKRSLSSPEQLKNNKKQKNKLQGETQKKIHDYWLGKPKSSNRFEQLSEDDDISVAASNSETLTDSPVNKGITEDVNGRQKTNKKLPVVPKPPPLYVAGVLNIQPLAAVLNTIAKDEYVLRILRNNEVKIQPNSSEAYLAISAALSERQTQFHTFKPKMERNFNVVLKGLHHSTDVNEIKEYLTNAGFDVVNVANVKQRTTKNPLSMFYINVKVGQNNASIYNLSTVLNTKVTFEPPIKKREIAQCIRCQRYGHTHKYCNHNPRCVKCAGEHTTSACPIKGMLSETKCVLCDGKHPANYKGCTVYKELQSKTFPPLRKKTMPEANKVTTEQVNLVNNVRSLSKPVGDCSAACRTASYAEAVIGNTSSNVGLKPTLTAPCNNAENILPTAQQNDSSELKCMLKMVLEQMSTMMSLLTTLIAKLSV